MIALKVVAPREAVVNAMNAPVKERKQRDYQPFAFAIECIRAIFLSSWEGTLQAMYKSVASFVCVFFGHGSPNVTQAHTNRDDI